MIILSEIALFFLPFSYGMLDVWIVLLLFFFFFFPSLAFVLGI